ncbi:MULTISPECIES: CsbD family protein [unclassified Paracoccus (in: a-proteobacteria)]|uniref:CsbD family protein n=1 Tax=unclassified Paracoccus (in: a-proteobacteria) TaxID=2688777 RepID=UPI003FA3C133
MPFNDFLFYRFGKTGRGAAHAVSGRHLSLAGPNFILPAYQTFVLCLLPNAISAGTGSAIGPFRWHTTSDTKQSKDDEMNWDIIEGKWNQLKGSVKEKWGDLTDDELTEVAGRKDKLAGKLQEKYGWTKEEADDQINTFFRDKT